MKTHLIKDQGQDYYDGEWWTITYCGIDSDYWSEQFFENVPENLTTCIENTTCKNCIKSYNKRTIKTIKWKQ